jgi:glycosyltransferase involved in cell wall biosynthesis
VIGLVAVVIPAANEEARVGRCLDALAVARGRLRVRRPEVAVRAVVVLDACTDGTARVVAERPDVTALRVVVRRVGAARAAGVAAMLAGTALPRHEVWLANTDADSQVRPDWLVGMVEHAAAGADLVLGTVLPGPELSAPATRRWHADHVLRDGHPHVHGANFGVRANVYRALGGWPQIATGEDVLLARRAASSGQYRIVRSSAWPVLTSARTHARAPYGFSSHLRGLTGLAV